MKENEIGDIVVDVAVAIHKNLGPGLLESVYEAILCYELSKKGLKVERQITIPLEYEGMFFKEAFRADVIVEAKVLLELKSVEHIDRAHKKQLLTYLKLSGKKLGYVLNFGAPLMKNGICRLVNGL